MGIKSESESGKKKKKRRTEGGRGLRRAGCGADALKCLMTEYRALGLQV